jgi:hypothetical protein
MAKMGWAAAVMALALGGIGSAAAQANGAAGFTAVYDIHAKGIVAGKFTYSVARAGDTYQASADRKMTGLVRIAVGDRQDYHYAAKGVIDAQGVHPQSYYHVGGKRDRRVEVDFSSGDAVTTANPPMGMGNPPATKAQREGAIDQVSAILAMSLAGGDPCQRTFHIYLDGRSRFDLVMRPDGSERVSTGAFKGVAHKCRVQYKPIAGFSDPQEPAEMTFLFGAVGSVYAPIRIAMPTDDAGIVTLEAKSFALKP